MPISALAPCCCAQFDYAKPPINYHKHAPTDCVARLSQQLEAGEKSLAWSDTHGWLPALLEALRVPQESQALVFSKTSLQHSRIDPSRPRALYFRDDAYVGWVRGGDIIEIAAVDNELGATFYSLKQAKADHAVIKRDSGDCMACHKSKRTQDVPGFLVRSVYPDPTGQPSYQQGTTTTDHRTPFADRFGGWYVTGQHGSMRHRGNVVVFDDGVLDREAGANLTTLPGIADGDAYLQPGSDIVALMVLEHQSQMHNLVTKALYAEKQALHYQAIMNEALDRPEDYKSASTIRRIESAAEEVVEYLFFCDEYELEAPVEGSEGFAKRFASLGPRDSQGRSLRDFDLEHRMFKYPCSYLVYSESFLALPPATLTNVKRRMTEVLDGSDDSGEFGYLSEEERKNIREILRETHPLFR